MSETGWIYVSKNSEGRPALMAKFQDGSTAVLATEPSPQPEWNPDLAEPEDM